jgi:hypothetical protein
LYSIRLTIFFDFYSFLKISSPKRSKFVVHEGKRTITVRRDDFIFNSSANKWHEVIDTFSARIGELTHSNASALFQADFSTTNRVSSVVSQIVLMESMQKYFQFEFVSLCTIPEINLMGSTRDWESVRAKTKKLKETVDELSVWYDKLEPLLSQFVDASQGKIDYEFWNQIYKGRYFIIFDNKKKWEYIINGSIRLR